MTDGYPDPDELAELAAYDITEGAAALDRLRELWVETHYGSAGGTLWEYERTMVGDGKMLRLATGGWSGCEDLLGAFRQSRAHFATWVLSARGGLHIFRYPYPN